MKGGNGEINTYAEKNKQSFKFDKITQNWVHSKTKIYVIKNAPLV